MEDSVMSNNADIINMLRAQFSESDFADMKAAIRQRRITRLVCLVLFSLASLGFLVQLELDVIIFYPTLGTLITFVIAMFLHFSSTAWKVQAITRLLRRAHDSLLLKDQGADTENAAIAPAPEGALCALAGELYEGAFHGRVDGAPISDAVGTH